MQYNVCTSRGVHVPYKVEFKIPRVLSIPYLVGVFYGPVRKNREKQVFFVLIRIAIMDFRGIQLRAKVDKQKILEK